jgi:hypothetical protein
MAFAVRRAQKDVPFLLLGRDIDDVRTKAGVERAVVDVLRRFGLLPPEPPKPTRLRAVKSE